MMANKKIYFKDGLVYSPKEIKVNVKTKMTGSDWEHHEIVIDPDEIGFG